MNSANDKTVEMRADSQNLGWKICWLAGHGELNPIRAPQSLTGMAVQWENDVDSGLRRAQESGRAVLLDFSAAPM